MVGGTTRALDPVTFEVILHRLGDIAEEMGIKYMRTSGSPILVGAYDAATGICLPNGELVAIGPYITTQANVLPVMIGSVLSRCRANPGIGPGDQFICNDPYLGATHIPDVATVAPFFYEGRLVAWAGSSGHWLDIGGPEPGSFNMNATTIYDEGLRMPPTRIIEGGRVREDLVALVMNQVRDPLAELDLRGQFVSNSTGLERLTTLFEEYGAETVEAAMVEAIDFVERRLRARLLEIPDGVWREIEYIDHDGHDRNLVRIVCTATKRGDSLRVDYTGTDPQVPGFVNCSFSGVRAATLSAMYIMLAYDLPWNQGVARCLELVAPPGTVVSAVHPAPVSAATLSSIILSLSVALAAFSKMLATSPRLHEEAMANWGATSMAPGIIGPNDRGVFTYLGEASHFGAGCGARTYADGVDTGGIIINTTASMPVIETTEAEYPVMYLFRRQLPDSGGPGKFRGGVAAGLALTPYDPGGPIESSMSSCGAEVPTAFGLAGGLPGGAVRYLRFVDTDIRRRLAEGRALPTDVVEIAGPRETTFVTRSHAPFPVDSIEFHNWQGGGGYGDPLERDPELVRQDLANELVTEAAARRIYGVALAGGTVDPVATENERAAIRACRLQVARPAQSVLGEAGFITEADWVEGGAGRGTLRYGDSVIYDFDQDQVRCQVCGHVLGAVHQDFRRGCVVEQAPVSHAGAGRGEEYDLGRVRLNLFYCPGCGRQLEVEVAVTGAPARGFRLAGMPGAETWSG